MKRALLILLVWMVGMTIFPMLALMLCFAKVFGPPGSIGFWEMFKDCWTGRYLLG